MATKRNKPPTLRLQVHNSSLEDAAEDTSLKLPWQLIAGVAGVLAALSVWVVVIVLAIIGWAIDRRAPFGSVLSTATDIWAALYGPGFIVGDAFWTVTPLGLTILCLIPVWWFSRITAPHAARDLDDDVDDWDRFRLAVAVTGLIAVCHAIPITIAAMAAGTGNRALVGTAVALVLGLVGGWLGVAPHLGASVRALLPEWARPVPAALMLSAGTVLLGGLAVVVTAVIQNFGRVSALYGQGGFSVLEGIMVTLVQLAFWVNLALWGSAWALGAGVRLGEQSLLTPAGTDIGFLPGLPIFGAVPAEGPHSPWLMCWLAVGVVGGIVAAGWVLYRRPTARFDEMSLVGGLAGVLAGLVVTAAAGLSGGHLGTGNLINLGPRIGVLAVLASAVMGLAGAATGLIWGLVRLVIDAGATTSEPAALPAGTSTSSASAAKTVTERVDDESVDSEAVTEQVDDEADEPTNPRIGPASKPEQ